MNVTVERDVLEAMLARVQGVAERRHTMPVLSHALVTSEPNRLSFVASDLEIVIRCVQGVTAAEKGSVALPARKFYDIAKVLPPGPVTVAAREGNYVEISAGRGHFRLAGLPASEFPEMPEKPAGVRVTVDAETLRRLVDRVAPFASSDETRYQMSGVLFEKREAAGKTLLRMVATDGHRLALADGEVPGIEGLVGERRTLVPKKGLLEIRRLAESGPGSIELSASDKFLFAGKGDTELWVRLLEGDFPDYEQVVPKENPIRARIAREPFVAALRRVSVMAPEKVHSVKLSFSGKQLEVSTTSPDLGEARDLIEVEHDGAPIKIGFNGRYLLDALNGVAEESVVFEIRDEVSQVLVRPEKEPSFQAVIMPMRLF